MTVLRQKVWIRQLVMVGYVLSVALLGFVHHALVMPSKAAPVDLVAYALPDGSLPSICLDDTGRREGRSALPDVCSACLLTAAAGLPTDTGAVASESISHLQQWHPSPDTLYPDARPAHVAHLRGPPLDVHQVS